MPSVKPGKKKNLRSPPGCGDGRPWQPAQVRLRIAWSAFVRTFGPINHTTVAVAADPETGEVTRRVKIDYARLMATKE